jgi:hypothetical protein
MKMRTNYQCKETTQRIRQAIPVWRFRFLNDRLHGAKWKYFAAVVGDDHLFPGRGIAPLLMTT